MKKELLELYKRLAHLEEYLDVLLVRKLIIHLGEESILSGRHRTTEGAEYAYAALLLTTNHKIMLAKEEVDEIQARISEIESELKGELNIDEIRYTLSDEEREMITVEYAGLTSLKDREGKLSRLLN